MPDKFRFVRKEKGFTNIDNSIFQDKRLSLKAKGLLCTALSVSGIDGWSFSIRGLAGLCKESRTAIESALEELESFGYLRRSRIQEHNQDGTFGGTEYVFFEVPGIEDPEAEEPCAQNVHTAESAPCAQNPHADNPHAENVPQENNKQKKTEEIKPPISPQGEIEGEKAKKDKPALPHDHEAYRCALYLDKEICARLPKKQPSNETTLQSWAADFDKCHRIDGYDWRTVMETLIFSQRDSFWQVNILSGRKFRGKLLQLMAKMNGGGRAAGRGPDTPDQTRVIERRGVREL